MNPNKLFNGWVREEGQQFVTHGGHGLRFRTETNGLPYNRRVQFEVVGDPGVFVPDLSDPVTADGLPRTAEAMWGEPVWLEAHEVVSGVVVSWVVCTIAKAVAIGGTRKEAWIAACMAAPVVKR